MKHKLKKVWPALAASLVTLTSVVSAVDDMQIRNLENRVSALEQRRGATGIINPPACPVVKDGVDLWLQAEALFMHATEDGLAYAIKNNAATGLNGSIKNVSYEWNWGFRLGAGINLPHDGWDALANWTWFRTHDDEDDDEINNQNLWQTQTNPTNGPAAILATKAEGHSHLHLNLVDFELGRQFFVSKWLTLRPFVGARGAWIARNFSFEYTIPGSEIDGHNHNRFRGAGLRGGLNTQWGLGSGWSFFGDMAFSLIYGTQKLHSHQDVDPSEARIQHTHDHWTMVRPMLDLALGVRWDQFFGDDSYRIRIQLGWEQHTLFGFEQDMNFMNNTANGKFAVNSGDLALSGLSLQARFDF